MAVDPLSATTFPKLFRMVKGLPLSVLTAATIALWLLLTVPFLRGGIPSSILPYLLFSALFFPILVAIGIAIALFGLWYRTNAPRLEKLYGPLYALLLTTHITTSTGIGAPKFRHRWENALEELSAIKSRRRAWRAAWRALFDRLKSTSGEVEYGTDLPRSKIVELVRMNERYADSHILMLVKRMDRARFEDPHGPNSLSDEDLALCDHIYAKYFRLKTWVTLLSKE